MFSHNTHDAPHAPCSVGEAALQAAFTDDIHRELGVRASNCARRQQKAVDSFYLGQVYAVAEQLGGALAHIKGLLAAKGVEITTARPWVDRGCPTRAWHAFTADEAALMERQAGFLRDWIEDSQYILAKANKLCGARPMVRVYPRPEHNSIPKCAGGTVAPEGTILKYVRVYQESKSIAQMCYEESGQLRDEMSVLAIFGGLSVCELLQLRATTGMTKSLALEYLFSEDINSNMHCRNHLLAVPIDKPTFSVFEGWPVDKSAPLPVHRQTHQKLRVRRGGATWQKFLRNWRRQVLRKTALVAHVANLERPTEHGTCTRCGGAEGFVVIQASNDTVCKSCGVVAGPAELGASGMDFHRIEYKRQSHRQSSCTYDPVNHFRAWLNRSQGKEQTYIPPEVIEAVRDEQRKFSLLDEYLTPKDVRKLLKRRNLADYYDNTVKILFLLTNRMPLAIHPDHETTFVRMFILLKEAWHKVKPVNRRNRISYSFLLYLFSELQQWHQYLPLFSPPKSEKKRAKQMLIFDDMCRYVDWKRKDDDDWPLDCPPGNVPQPEEATPDQ